MANASLDGESVNAGCLPAELINNVKLRSEAIDELLFDLAAELLANRSYASAKCCPACYERIMGREAMEEALKKAEQESKPPQGSG